MLVLNLNKPGFPGDIEESLLGDPAFEVVSWPNYALKAMASAILAPQLSNRRYASDDPAVEASKLQYRKFLLALWQRFRELKPIDAVVTANFGYFAQREFGAALKEAGTPLVVLHKENVKSPERGRILAGDLSDARRLRRQQDPRLQRYREGTASGNRRRGP